MKTGCPGCGCDTEYDRCVPPNPYYCEACADRLTLIADLEHIAAHIGDDDYNLPRGAKSTVLSAADAFRKGMNDDV